MAGVKRYRHLERIKLGLRPENKVKLLTVNQARKLLKRESKFVTNAMRQGDINFFYIHTPGMDFFFIYLDDKFKKLYNFAGGNKFDYKKFREHLESRPV